MVEALRSPGVAEDRRELLKLKDGRVATPRYEVRRRAEGVHQELRRRGARVHPYMDDFLIIAKTREEAFVQRERVQRVLARLGLTRNEKKGQWEPGQLIEHLGLEVDLRDGLFRVTAARVAKIHAQAKDIICTASRDRRWLSARRLAAFNGLCQSVYLAVPAARLYLRELYFVLSTKRSWGAKVKLTRQAFHDLSWWARLPVISRWNGRKIWRSPTRAKLHTDSSLRAWGGVLNLDKEARGFWPDELQHLHITHLELEAVFKTVQSFMRELEGKVKGPLCPEQTRRFAAAGDVEVGRDHVPHPPEAVSNSSYVVPVGTKLKIYWELDDAWYPGAVALFDEDGFANIVYDDGDKEVVDLANERYEIIGDVEPPVNVKNIFELGTSEHTDLAVQMQQAALQPTTKGNYDPKADQQVVTNEVLTERTYLPARHVWAAQQAATTMKPTTLDELRLLRACVYTVFAYVTFGRPDTGVAMQREHICSTEDVLSVVLLKEKGRRHHQAKQFQEFSEAVIYKELATYNKGVADFLEKGTIQATSMQSYLATINKNH
ncbi:hypothetical protein CYMTET_46705 [Cymbomonas tetramitiformis]|uniref:Reverse transcriptase domain-containing protein n=1 Tax=Cymbomonas tetramitiformis TaxID=36881 RepID=A0AAE0BVL7_9CHLO|nr:hypothetical protein CYMTET_46705 [Cymbomonas tetramitiformis]